jgi:hypothetical protein
VRCKLSTRVCGCQGCGLDALGSRQQRRSGSGLARQRGIPTGGIPRQLHLGPRPAERAHGSSLHAEQPSVAPSACKELLYVMSMCLGAAALGYASIFQCPCHSSACSVVNQQPRLLSRRSAAPCVQVPVEAGPSTGSGGSPMGSTQERAEVPTSPWPGQRQHQVLPAALQVSPPHPQQHPLPPAQQQQHAWQPDWTSGQQRFSSLPAPAAGTVGRQQNSSASCTLLPALCIGNRSQMAL